MMYSKVLFQLDEMHVLTLNAKTKSLYNSGYPVTLATSLFKSRQIQIMRS